MIKVRNALAAGTMMAAALIAPMTTPTAFAVADTTATLSSLQKPCSEYKNPQRCREERRRHHRDHWDHRDHRNHRDHWENGHRNGEHRDGEHRNGEHRNGGHRHGGGMDNGMSENTRSGNEGGARVND